MTDLALHSTSTTTAIQGLPGNTSQAFGTSLNQSAVALENSSYIQLQGALTAINDSSTHQVFTLGSDDSQMAYIARVTSNLPSDASFIASSFGIVSDCEVITVQCFSLPSTPPPGSDGQFDEPFDCSPAGYPDFSHAANVSQPFMLGTTTEFINGTANASPLPLARNPFTSIYIDYIGDFTNIYPFQYINDSIVETLHGFLVITACNISVFDIQLRYSQGNYTLLDKTLSALDSSSVLVQPLALFNPQTDTDDSNNPFVLNLANDITASTAANRDELGNYISGDISRLLLAYSSGYLQPSPAIAYGTLGVITLYPIASLVCALASIFAYATMALYVFFWSATDISTGVTPAVAIAANKKQLALGITSNVQLYITKPATLIAALCRQLEGSSRSKHSEAPDGWVQESVDEMFDEKNTTAVSKLYMNIESQRSRQVRLSLGDSMHKEYLPQGMAHERSDLSPRGPAASEILLVPTRRPYTDATPIQVDIRIPLMWIIPTLLVAVLSAMLATSLPIWIIFR